MLEGGATAVARRRGAEAHRARMRDRCSRTEHQLLRVQRLLKHALDAEGGLAERVAGTTPAPDAEVIQRAENVARARTLIGHYERVAARQREMLAEAETAVEAASD